MGVHAAALRRTLMRHAVLALFVAGLTTGCDDPKAASKDNFAKALTAFFDRTCLMLSPDPSVFATNAFPATVREFTPVDYGDGPRYEALTQAGLLIRAPLPSDTYPAPVQSFVFDLTDKGRALYKPAGALGPGSPGGFCAGYIRVVSVDQFTNPVVQGGQRVSQVTFTARADGDTWVRQREVAAAFQRELQRTQPFQQIVPMVQTSDGWEIALNPPASASN